MRKLHVPGVAIAIVDAHGALLVSAFGYADASKHVRVEGSTVFEAASLGKPLFCYAVLHHSGGPAFDLDRPISDYLGSPVAADPAAATITARQLFSHTSGLVFSAADHKRRLLFRPGSEWKYSGLGYLVVQHAVERLWREPLDQLVSETVTRRLGMAGTYYVSPRGEHATVAVGHDRQGHALPRIQWTTASAASSLRSSAVDYGRFVSAMLAGVRCGDEAATAMLKPQAVVDRKLSLFWGLGWAVAKPHGDSVFLHWGSNPGFKSLALGAPVRNLGMVVMTNADNGLELATALVPAVYGRDYAFLKFFMLHPDD